MDIPAFKAAFQQLDEEGQQNILGELTDEELASISSEISKEGVTSEQGAPGVEDDIAFSIKELRNRVAYQKSLDDPQVELEDRQKLIREGLTRGLAGFEQLGIRLQEAIGIKPGGSTEDFTVKENLRREEFDKNNPYASDIRKTLTQGLGEFLPSFAVGALMPSGGVITLSKNMAKGTSAAYRVGQLGTRFSRVGVDAAGGAVAGAPLYAQSDEERNFNMLFGAFMSGTVRAGVEAYDLLRPTNILRQNLGLLEAQETKTAQEARDINQAVGGRLDLSEETGDATVLGIELVGRRASGVSNILNIAEERKLAPVVKFFQDHLDTLNKESVPVETLGHRIRGAFDRAFDSATGSRRAQWQADMADARKIAGKTPFIKTDNLRAHLKELITELGDKASDSPSKAVAKTLRRELDWLAKDKEISILRAQILLQKYGEWGAGTGRPLRDVTTGKDRFVGAQLSTKFLEDIEATVKSSPLSGAAIALERARANYKEATNNIKALGNNAVEVLMERNKIPAPEKFVDVFSSKSTKPSEIRAIVSILDKHDPTLVNAIKRNWIEDALKKSTRLDTEKLAGSYNFDPRTFLNELDLGGDNAMALFSPKDRNNLRMGVAYVEKVVEKGRGKVVTPEGETRAIEQAGMNLFSWNPIFFAGWVLKNVAPRSIARAMFTDDGLQALRVIADPAKYPPTLVASSAFFLASLNEREDVKKSTRPTQTIPQ